MATARPGHPAGGALRPSDARGPEALRRADRDRALAAFAEQLRATPRDMDVVGRLGGDEFAILLVQATVEQAEGVVARLQAAVDAADRAAGRPYAIAFSHGIVAFEAKRHPAIADLLAETDERMYALKRTR